jgi:hypothetical protein
LAHANRPKGAAPIYVGDAYLNLEPIYILKRKKEGIIFLLKFYAVLPKRIVPRASIALGLVVLLYL